MGSGWVFMVGLNFWFLVFMDFEFIREERKKKEWVGLVRCLELG